MQSINDKGVKELIHDINNEVYSINRGTKSVQELLGNDKQKAKKYLEFLENKSEVLIKKWEEFKEIIKGEVSNG